MPNCLRPKTAGSLARFAPAVAVRALPLALVLFVAVPQTVGQIVRVERSTVTAPTLGPAQRTEVEAFAEYHAQRLLAGEWATAGQSVEDLIEPLRDPETTVAFRQYLADSIEPSLRELAEAGLENPAARWRRFSAVKIAGWLATERSTSLVVADLRSDEPEIRFFAYVAAATVFDAASVASPAVARPTLERLQDSLAAAVRTEAAPRHADAAARALAQSAGLPQQVFPGLGARGLTMLGNATADRVVDAEFSRAPGESRAAEMEAWLRAAAVMRNAILPTAEGVTDATARAAIRLGGSIGAWVSSQVEAGTLADVSPEQTEVKLLTSVETLLLFGSRKLGRPELRTELAGPLGGGDLARFRTQWQRAFQTLTQPPYGFAADELVASR